MLSRRCAFALLVGLGACRQTPESWYPVVDVAAGAAVDTACPAVAAPRTWQHTALPGGVTVALPPSARLFLRHDTVRHLQTWLIDEAGGGGTQILLIVRPLESLRDATDTVPVPPGTPRALVCRFRLPSGVVQVVASGEVPGFTDQHPLMFSAWLPGPKGVMINVSGFGDEPALRAHSCMMPLQLSLGVG